MFGISGIILLLVLGSELSGAIYLQVITLLLNVIVVHKDQGHLHMAKNLSTKSQRKIFLKDNFFAKANLKSNKKCSVAKKY